MIRTYPITVIVLAQLMGGSLWFSVNGIASQLLISWQLSSSQLGYLTSAVQLGFILGTFVVAMSGLSDRFRSSQVFFVSCLFGAAANAAMPLFSESIESALVFRFLTGLALAGIYPLGMKLVVSWAPDKTGFALGWLVGMLTLGTALPHLFSSLGGSFSWQLIMLTSTLLAIVAGLIILSLGDGPHLAQALVLDTSAIKKAFAIPAFRLAAFGYFGHMWELYAFWTITPLLIIQLVDNSIIWNDEKSIAAISFVVIGVGFFGCVIGGVLSRYWGSKKVATVALMSSGTMCFAYPLLQEFPPYVSLTALIFWGVTVVADSPQFSALSARACPKNIVGSALSIQNSIGFLLTIISISIVTSLYGEIGAHVTWILLPGPLIGLFMMHSTSRFS